VTYHFSEIESVMETICNRQKTGFTGSIPTFAIPSGSRENRSRQQLRLSFKVKGQNGAWRNKDQGVSSEIYVLDAMADPLSKEYAKWLIKEYNVSADNLEMLNLSFGNALKLENGMLIKGSKEICLRNVSKVEIKTKRVTKGDPRFENPVFALDVFSLDENQRKKERANLEVHWDGIENVDLLFHILGIAAQGDIQHIYTNQII